MSALKLRNVNAGAAWRIATFTVLAVILLSPVFAQKNKKNQKQPPPDAQGSALPVSDDDAIERQISQMLAAWQTGDSEGMRAFYADDVLLVSSAWEPPVSGWPAYLRAYQAQRARIQSVQLQRSNTFRKVTGNSAWATYQWELSGVMDGAATNAHGHTTLVFEKRNGRWLIVLNHTSLTQEPASAPAGRSGTF
jgi:uncharacterized protein (TIGR02246 family)